MTKRSRTALTPRWTRAAEQTMEYASQHGPRDEDERAWLAQVYDANREHFVARFEECEFLGNGQHCSSLQAGPILLFDADPGLVLRARRALARRKAYERFLTHSIVRREVA